MKSDREVAGAVQRPAVTRGEVLRVLRALVEHGNDAAEMDNAAVNAPFCAALQRAEEILWRIWVYE